MHERRHTSHLDGGFISKPLLVQRSFALLCKTKEESMDSCMGKLFCAFLASFQLVVKDLWCGEQGSTSSQVQAELDCPFLCHFVSFPTLSNTAPSDTLHFWALVLVEISLESQGCALCTCTAYLREQKESLLSFCVLSRLDRSLQQLLSPVNWDTDIHPLTPPPWIHSRGTATLSSIPYILIARSVSHTHGDCSLFSGQSSKIQVFTSFWFCPSVNG